MEVRAAEITRVLQSVAEGDRQAEERLADLVYDELKTLAHAQLSRSGRRAIQTTDLVNESWVRLSVGLPSWDNRRHFYGAAANAMRNFLVDERRKRAALKRDSDRTQELGDELVIVLDPPVEDVLSLHVALEELERSHPRQAKAAVLRWFGGLQMPEVADVLGVSLATAERDWRLARAWLQNTMKHDER